MTLIATNAGKANLDGHKNFIFEPANPDMTNANNIKDIQRLLLYLDNGQSVLSHAKSEDAGLVISFESVTDLGSECTTFLGELARSAEKKAVPLAIACISPKVMDILRAHNLHESYHLSDQSNEVASEELAAMRNQTPSGGISGGEAHPNVKESPAIY